MTVIRLSKQLLTANWDLLEKMVAESPKDD